MASCDVNIEISALSREALFRLRQLGRKGCICWRGHIHASKKESDICWDIGCDLGHIHPDREERERCKKYQRAFIKGNLQPYQFSVRSDDPALSWRLYNDPEFRSTFTASAQSIADSGAMNDAAAKL